MSTRAVVIRPPASVWAVIGGQLRELPDCADLLYTLSVHRINARR